MPESIEISYKSKGQLGPRPRKVPLHGTFLFTSKDPGDLTIEFLDDTPLVDGSRTAVANKDLTAGKLGKFKFKCILKQNGKTLKLGDPADPSSGVGGELEVGPG